MRPLSFLVVASAAWLAGCAHTSTEQITPWFRVSAHHPASTIVAESGGPHTTYEADFRRDGEWAVVSDNADAMSIARGERVLFMSAAAQGPPEIRWIDRGGASGRFSCQGDIHARKKGADELLCLDFTGVESSFGEPRREVPVSLRWVDANGALLARRKPQELVLPANPYRSWSERHFLGFVDGEPAVVVENGRTTSDADSFPGKECSYFVLGAGGVRRIGSPVVVDKHPPYVAAAHTSCTEAAVLELALPGITLERGESLAHEL